MEGEGARKVGPDGDLAEVGDPAFGHEVVERKARRLKEEVVSPFGPDVNFDRKRNRGRGRHDRLAEARHEAPVHVACRETNVGTAREDFLQTIAVAEGFVHLPHPRVHGRVVHERENGAAVRERGFQTGKGGVREGAPVAARLKRVEPHDQGVFAFDREFDGFLSGVGFDEVGEEAHEVRAPVVVPREHAHGNGEVCEGFRDDFVSVRLAVAGDVARHDDEVHSGGEAQKPGTNALYERGRVGLAVGEGACGFHVQVGELQNGGHNGVPSKNAKRA